MRFLRGSALQLLVVIAILFVFVSWAGAETSVPIVDPWREIELYFVVPTEVSSQESEDEISAQLVNTVAAAQTYFNDLRIVLKLVGLDVITDPASDPFRTASLRQDSYQMLEILRNEWSNRKLPRHDAVIVVGRGRYRGILGLSYTGTSCVAPDYSFLFASQGGSSAISKFQLVNTLAHELGHFIGMNHDNSISAVGMSLMHSSFPLKAFQFSQLSRSEFVLHAGSGKEGGVCFGRTVSPPQALTAGGPGQGTLSFEHGKYRRWDIREGERHILPVRVKHHRPGVFYVVQGLPTAAVFDPFSAEIEFRPDFSVSSRKRRVTRYQISTFAKSAAGQAATTFTLRVHHTNRPPRFVSPSNDSLQVRSGQRVSLLVSATDDDQDDSARVRLKKRRSFFRLPGKQSYRRVSNGLELSWDIPVGISGVQVLRFQARDRERAITEKLITITILP